MRNIVTFSSGSAGEVSPQLRGRWAWEKFGQSMRHAKNVVVQPIGSVCRRSGTEHIEGWSGSAAGAKRRLLPFNESLGAGLVVMITSSDVTLWNRNRKITGYRSTYSDNETLVYFMRRMRALTDSERRNRRPDQVSWEQKPERRLSRSDIAPEPFPNDGREYRYVMTLSLTPDRNDDGTKWLALPIDRAAESSENRKRGRVTDATMALVRKKYWRLDGFPESWGVNGLEAAFSRQDEGPKADPNSRSWVNMVDILLTTANAVAIGAEGDTKDSDYVFADDDAKKPRLVLLTDSAAEAGIESPYEDSDLPLIRSVQTLDTLFLFTKNVAPHKLYKKAVDVNGETQHRWILEKALLRFPSRRDFTGDKSLPEDENIFRDGNWPIDALFHQDRLVAVGTGEGGVILCGSRVGNYYDFAIKRRAGESATDWTDSSLGYAIRLLSRTNLVARWLESLGNNICIGTNDGVWLVKPQRSDRVMSNVNIQATPMQSDGAAVSQAIMVNKQALYINRARDDICEIVYSVGDDGYVSHYVASFAKHFTSSLFWKIAYENNHKIIWLCHDDGSLTGVTYSRDDQIIAWTRQELGAPTTRGKAKVLDICVVAGEDGDAVWLLVERNHGPAPTEGASGADEFRVSLEVLKPVWAEGWSLEGKTIDNETQRYAHYLDDAVLVEGPSTASGDAATDRRLVGTKASECSPGTSTTPGVLVVEGLTWLAGDEVVCCGKHVLGGVRKATVDNEGKVSVKGSWTAGARTEMTAAAASTHIVIGHSYVSEFSTNNLLAQVKQVIGVYPEGSLASVVVSLWQSAGGEIGVDRQGGDEVLWEELSTSIRLSPSDHIEMTQEKLGTWQAEVKTSTQGPFTLNGGTGKVLPLHFRQKLPLPFNLIEAAAVIATVGTANYEH